MKVAAVEVSHVLPFMRLSQTCRIDSRDAHPFPWAQEYGQTWCPLIPEAHTLLGLRLVSI